MRISMTCNLSNYWNSIHQSLFPNHSLRAKCIELKQNPYFSDEETENLGEVTPKHKEIMIVLDKVNFDTYLYDSLCNTVGRPPKSRLAMAKAFQAKAILNLPSTEALIDRLKVDLVLRRICGFDSMHKIPCKATFSNVYSEFSRSGLPSFIHEQLVKSHYEEKIIEHISRDSTQIDTKEKAAKKEPSEEKKKFPRGRPKAGEVRPEKEKSRIEKQKDMTLEEMLEDLPQSADRGTKKNAKGYKTSWNGYKLHLDVADGGVIISAILTSASVHDSQVSIPLESMTNKRVTSLYSLMDAAYDAELIKEDVKSHGKVAIIDPNPRRGEAIPLEPCKAERYKDRGTAERANSHLKDTYGCRSIQVKTNAKVMVHLMFGVLAVTAMQMIRTFG